MLISETDLKNIDGLQAVNEKNHQDQKRETNELDPESIVAQLEAIK